MDDACAKRPQEELRFDTQDVRNLIFFFDVLPLTTLKLLAKPSYDVQRKQMGVS
jgi:hypothetical protein